MSELRSIGAGTASRSVPMLRWPEEEPRRRILAAKRCPRLLVVPAHIDPPVASDELEDWLRDPPDGPELVARLDALRLRAARAEQPRVDDGVLRFRDRWSVVPQQQEAVARLLVEEVGNLVRTEAVTEVYVRSGGGGHGASVRTMLNRLAPRFRAIGLQLHFIRGRGVLLDVRAPDDA